MPSAFEEPSVPGALQPSPFGSTPVCVPPSTCGLVSAVLSGPLVALAVSTLRAGAAVFVPAAAASPPAGFGGEPLAAFKVGLVLAQRPVGPGSDLLEFTDKDPRRQPEQASAVRVVALQPFRRHTKWSMPPLWQLFDQGT